MKYIKKALLFLLLLSLMISAIPTAWASGPVYADWFKTNYLELTQLELIPESFKSLDLTKSISRKEMCEFAVLSLEKITDSAIEPSKMDHFTDTQDINIVKAKELGIVNGYTNGTFQPNKNLTRQEFFVIVENFCKAAAFKPSSDGASLQQFTDRASVSDWAKDAAVICVKYGYVNGYTDNTVRPKNNLSRQEAMTMFLRCFKGLSEYYYYVANASVIALSGTGGATTYAGDVAVTGATGSMIVDTSKLNVRSLPGTNGAILGSLLLGREATVTGVCSNGWLRINYNGKTGYVSGDYLVPKKGTTEVASDLSVKIANEAMEFIGYPYIWGAESPKEGFDCSGLVYYVFTKNGFKMNRVADDQMEQGTLVPYDQLLAGDLVFFGYGNYADHVGIYIGNGNFVHAANPRAGVKVSSMSETYYANKYLCAKRIVH